MRLATRTPRLPQEWTATWLVALTAAMMGFLACLGLAAAAATEALARSWTDDLYSRATVTLDIAPGAEFETRVEEALSLLQSDARVVRARVLSDSEMTALMSRVLGESIDISELPVPTMIDLDLMASASREATAIAASLRERLSEAGFRSEVDTHREWAERLRHAAERLRRFAFMSLLVLTIAAATNIVLSTAAGLSAQSGMVDVLKLIGATDEYVARIFVRRAQTQVFVGSAIGAVIAVAILSLGGDNPDDAVELAPLTPSMRADPALLPWFAGVPLALALIATLAAHLTVMLSIRRRLM